MGYFNVFFTILSLFKDKSGSNIDYISVDKVIQANNQYEAEYATIKGCKVKSNAGGFNGIGFVDFQNKNNDYIEWEVEAPEDDEYEIEVCYANEESDDRPLKVEVNGNVMDESLSFPSTGSWNSWETVKFTADLNEGTNTVKLTAKGKSGANIDYLSIYNNTIYMQLIEEELAINTDQIEADLEYSRQQNGEIVIVDITDDTITYYYKDQSSVSPVTISMDSFSNGNVIQLSSSYIPYDLISQGILYTWYIPFVGEIVVTTIAIYIISEVSEAIGDIVGATIVDASSWVYNEIQNWIAYKRNSKFQNFLYHFNKHAKEFSDMIGGNGKEPDKSAYFAMAVKFLNEKGANILEGVQKGYSDGRIAKFNTKTLEFLIYNPKTNKIITYYLPKWSNYKNGNLPIAEWMERALKYFEESIY